MGWQKSSPGLIEVFHRSMPDDARVERRQMFGYPAAFVNGNMFTGLHQENMVVRLSEPKREDLIARGGRTFEPMAGRPMREYVVLPSSIVEAPSELRRWTRDALEYAATLPPKQAKGASKAKPAAGAPARQKPAAPRAAAKKTAASKTRRPAGKKR